MRKLSTAHSAPKPDSGQSSPRAWRLHISGTVQGVGFRPFIHRIATKANLTGWVNNASDGVHIHLEGAEKNFQSFMDYFKTEMPPAAQVDNVAIQDSIVENYTVFTIVPSTETPETITEISPDLAVCPDCLQDMQHDPRRIHYAFTNCTNCGPRYSIIRALPYDRQQTSMASFQMCPACQQEYEVVTDRRFHAQPNACLNCGPQLTLWIKQSDGFERITDGDPISLCASLIDRGQVVAIKGLGGFHLACDATSSNAVQRLRKLKHRETKPFAVMAKDLSALRQFTSVTSTEATTQGSPAAPIVLLQQTNALAPEVTNGLPTLGAMLPYTPLHHLLMAKLKTPVIVLTSANPSDEPICIDGTTLRAQMGAGLDAVLDHDRVIVNRADDSVVQVVLDQVRVIRRSRGLAPRMVKLPFDASGILAVGAELKSTFAIGLGNKALISQYLGDLKNNETYEFYRDTLDHLSQIYRFTPQLIAHDLHPDYLSTRFARQSHAPQIAMQHHEAHIASCMAENQLISPVIGVSFDGQGYGADKAVWGGEFFVGDLSHFDRAAHFRYVTLPGGDHAAKDIDAMAISYLHQTFGRDLINLPLQLIKTFNPSQLDLLMSVIEKHFNAPPTSSVGRLLDAVAALTGICHQNSFEAEAPMHLDNAIDPRVTGHYPFVLSPKTDSPMLELDFRLTIEAVVRDLGLHMPLNFIVTQFMNTIVAATCETVQRLSQTHNIRQVALSGGVFQNAYLLSRVQQMLTDLNFNVYSQKTVPTNDGGISLGQLAIAAHRHIQT